jgi:hypothetical protein
MKRKHLFTAILLVVTAVTLSAQAKPKKFLTAPLTIEDQGSFFVGGVKKITDHASVPPLPAAPTPPLTRRIRSRSGRCTFSSRSPLEIWRLARDYGAWLVAHGRGARVDA